MHHKGRLVACFLLALTCFFVVRNHKSFQLQRDSSSTVPSKKPNIVFILADDLGWGDVGYLNPLVITPTIDKLAREGVILNQSYVAQSCSPSRAAIMSGYYPYRLGFQEDGVTVDMPTGVPLHLMLLPRKLQQLGYSTYMVGKWHLGFCKKEYTPNGRGFDHFYGYYGAGQDHYTHVGKCRGLDLHHDFEPDRTQNGTYSTYLFSGKAVEFIKAHDKSKPFFLYLAFQNVHSPLQVPEKYTDMYPSVANENRRIKLGMITAMDDGIAKLVNALRRHGFWDNTLIVFSTDNGAPQNERFEGNNWPLRGTKKSLFEGGTRAVGFIHGSMLEKTGYVNNQLIHAVDWHPTLSTVAGAKTLDPDMDGLNVWNTLRKNVTSPRKEFVYNIIERIPIAGIRVHNYKLIVGNSQFSACRVPPPETEMKFESDCASLIRNGVYLYDLKNDPTESFNLAEKMPQRVKEMNTRIEEYKKKLVPTLDRGISEEQLSDPQNFGGVWMPGWC
ncbi:arylsulfatase B-like isoform X2 [Ptychodera flava]|uniref:arylsulfatase B-like isoform X2 n=1 Tax=Ptychodera flava TaxID=63121 RepID=UPI00396A07F6